MFNFESFTDSKGVTSAFLVRDDKEIEPFHVYFFDDCVYYDEN